MRIRMARWASEREWANLRGATRENVHVGHGDVGEAVAPAEFHGHVWANKVEARVEGGREAGLVLNRHEEADKVLGHVDITRFGGRVDGVLVHSILLGELHALGPALVALVEVGSDAAEL